MIIPGRGRLLGLALNCSEGVIVPSTVLGAPPSLAIAPLLLGPASGQAAGTNEHPKAFVYSGTCKGGVKWGFPLGISDRSFLILMLFHEKESNGKQMKSSCPKICRLGDQRHSVVRGPGTCVLTRGRGISVSRLPRGKPPSEILAHCFLAEPSDL